MMFNLASKQKYARQCFADKNSSTFIMVLKSFKQ